MLSHLSTTIISFIQSLGYAGVFVLMTLESALIPIPSEVTMPFAGFLASQGTLVFWIVVLVGAVGNVIGSLIGYGIGYFLEESVLLRLIRRYGKFILVTEEDYATSNRWFASYGSGVVFFSRLLPAVRTFISLPAGMFKMNLWKFTLYTFIGSLIWSALLASIGLYLGSRWDTLGPVFSKFHYVIILVAVLLVGWYVYHKLHKRPSH